MLIRHLRGNVVGYFALFIALGGTSYAVATGSINSREIKNNTVRSKDIRNNDVSSSDVRNSSLLARDFKSGQLPAGPRGRTGPAGPRGSTGPTGLSGVEYVAKTVPADSADKSGNAVCPEGKTAIGTGAEIYAPTGDVPTEVGLNAVGYGNGRLSTYAEAIEHSATSASWGLYVEAVCAYTK